MFNYFFSFFEVDFLLSLKTILYFRAVIHALIENLQEQIEQPTLTLQRKEELKSFTSIFYNVELIWHCVEILFIDTWRGIKQLFFYSYSIKYL